MTTAKFEVTNSHRYKRIMHPKNLKREDIQQKEILELLMNNFGNWISKKKLEICLDQIDYEKECFKSNKVDNDGNPIIQSVEFEKNKKGNLVLDEYGNPIISKINFEKMRYRANKVNGNGKPFIVEETLVTRSCYNARVKELREIGFIIENTFDNDNGEKVKENSRFRLIGIGRAKR